MWRLIFLVTVVLLIFVGSVATQTAPANLEPREVSGLVRGTNASGELQLERRCGWRNRFASGRVSG